MRPEADAVQRVWLALAGSRPSGEDIDIAVALARRFRAELRGTMLHDEALMALAELPIAAEITVLGKRRGLSRPDLVRSLRLVGETVRTMLDHAIGDSDIPWSFEDEGHPLHHALTRLEETEVLILSGRRPYPRVGSPRKHDAITSVLSIYDESPGATRGLQLAASIAASEGRPLVVCLIAADPDQEHLLQNRARDFLAGTELEVRYRTMSCLEPAVLGRIRREETADRVIVAVGTRLDEAVGLCDRVHCALILVR